MVGTGVGHGLARSRDEQERLAEMDSPQWISHRRVVSAKRRSVVLDKLFVGRRHEVDMNRFLMFYAVRALLRQHGIGAFRIGPGNRSHHGPAGRLKPATPRSADTQYSGQPWATVLNRAYRSNAGPSDSNSEPPLVQN